MTHNYDQTNIYSDQNTYGNHQNGQFYPQNYNCYENSQNNNQLYKNELLSDCHLANSQNQNGTIYQNYKSDQEFYDNSYYDCFQENNMTNYSHNNNSSHTEYQKPNSQCYDNSDDMNSYRL